MSHLSSKPMTPSLLYRVECAIGAIVVFSGMGFATCFVNASNIAYEQILARFPDYASIQSFTDANVEGVVMEADSGKTIRLRNEFGYNIETFEITPSYEILWYGLRVGKGK